jgi:2'-5' RNA ligase
MMPHYFLAIPVPEEVKKHLSERASIMKKRLTYGYWTDRADYHITLFFIGEASSEQIDQLKAELWKIAVKQPATEIRLNGFGTFGKKDEPRVVWMGVQYDSYLPALSQAVQECAVKVGFQEEKRPYRPHITIAKKWRGRPVTNEEWQDSLPEFEPLGWRAVEFALYRVEPAQTPRYVMVERFPLQER